MAEEYKPDLDLWRNRAEEAPTQAEQMSNPETRRMMLQIAETYERMIEFEKGIEAARKVTRRRPRCSGCNTSSTPSAS